jgi:hypothetical protein
MPENYADIVGLRSIHVRALVSCLAFSLLEDTLVLNIPAECVYKHRIDQNTFGNVNFIILTQCCFQWWRRSALGCTARE